MPRGRRFLSPSSAPFPLGLEADVAAVGRGLVEVVRSVGTMSSELLPLAASSLRAMQGHLAPAPRRALFMVLRLGQTWRISSRVPDFASFVGTLGRLSNGRRSPGNAFSSSAV